MKYIVANWKANKTEEETVAWFREMTTFNFAKAKNLEIITCLPYVFLCFAQREIKQSQLPIKLGAQNVSHLEEGPYTGVITAGMLQSLVSYVMIGHSERRLLLKETDQMILEKLRLCLKHQLRPIICVSNINQVKYLKEEFKNEKTQEDSLFLYEPIEAIGSGKCEDPQETFSKIKEIKEIMGEMPVLYGGSVTAENILSYLIKEEIDGVAVGGASLDPQSFLKVLNNAAKI